MFTEHTFSEVYKVIDLLGREYKEKLPSKLLKFIDDNRDKECIIIIDPDESMLEQDISEEARDFLAYLDLEYWCDEEEKKKLIKQYKDNEEKLQNQLKEKYDVEQIFEKRRNAIEENNERKDLVEYKEKKNVFSKIINFFKKIFKK